MSRKPVAAAVAAVFAAAAVALSAPADATYPGTVNGRLAFGLDITTSTASPDIYSIRPDGSGLRRLTFHPGADICAAYSPNGNVIAYCSERAKRGAFEIWTMRSDGRDKRRVTRMGEFAIFPDFSPTGRRIAFFNGTDGEIYEVTRKTGRLRQLTRNDHVDAYPAYSPDGTKIAFISDRTGVRQVWVMNVDGSDPVQLTFDDAAKDQLPDWSPDGTKIAFQSMGTGNGDLYVMDADGGNVRRLTATPEMDLGPAWSPDGTQVAFLRVLHPATPTARAIYVVDADGTDERLAAFGTRVPAWQPRGVPD